MEPNTGDKYVWFCCISLPLTKVSFCFVMISIEKRRIQLVFFLWNYFKEIKNDAKTNVIKKHKSPVQYLARASTLNYWEPNRP